MPGGTVDADRSTCPARIAMSGTAGKVALVNSTAALTCATGCATADVRGRLRRLRRDRERLGRWGARPRRCPTPPRLSRSATHANTANNGADFTVGAPSPGWPAGAAAEPPTPPDVGSKTIAEIQGTGAASPLVG